MRDRLALCTLGASGAVLAGLLAAPEVPLFREAAAESGLLFQHLTGATGEFFMPEIMGPGVALLDYDQDGDLDVYAVQGRVLNPGKSWTDALFPPPAGYRPGNRLFRNEWIPSRELRFTDVTETAGVGDDGYGMGVAAGDYNNDGYPDLYVTNFGSNLLYRNNGDGTFSDVTRQAGVDDPRWSSSASFLDYDGDGDLDLFVVNYVDFTVRGNKRCYAPTGEPDYCSPSNYRPLPDRLFRNEGQGRWVEVTQSSGISASYGPGLGVIGADFNGDGLLDIYVANDGTENLLWINRGDGSFEEVGLLAGVAYSQDGLPQGGMGVAAGDIDADGDEDLIVTNLTMEGSTLYENDGRGFFHDASRDFGLHGPSFLSTGFGVQWFDYDNDGWLDLFAVNGAVTVVPPLRGSPYPYHQRNQLFRNENGRFREVTAKAGPALEASEVSRGAAFGDIDNDGDIDIVLSNNNGPLRLLLNQVGSSLPWVSVSLEGTRDNRQGLGARLALIRKGESPLWRRAHTDGSYLSAGDARVHFGLGTKDRITALEVYWPSGARERFSTLAANSLLQLRQGSGEAF